MGGFHILCPIVYTKMSNLYLKVFVAKLGFASALTEITIFMSQDFVHLV